MIMIMIIIIIRVNRIDARFIDGGSKMVTLLEMSCPWVKNRKQKEEEKMIKYATLWLELKRQHPGYEVRQYNITIDVLGRYSQETSNRVRNLLRPLKGRLILRRMQKAVLSSCPNIARSLKLCIEHCCELQKTPEFY